MSNLKGVEVIRKYISQPSSSTRAHCGETYAFISSNGDGCYRSIVSDLLLRSRQLPNELEIQTLQKLTDDSTSQALDASRDCEGSCSVIYAEAC